jgi:hypothetical protein
LGGGGNGGARVQGSVAASRLDRQPFLSAQFGGAPQHASVREAAPQHSPNEPRAQLQKRGLSKHMGCQTTLHSPPPPPSATSLHQASCALSTSACRAPRCWTPSPRWRPTEASPAGGGRGARGLPPAGARPAQPGRLAAGPIIGDRHCRPRGGLHGGPTQRRHLQPTPSPPPPSRTLATPLFGCRYPHHYVF